MEILIKHMKFMKVLLSLWDSQKNPWLLDALCHISILLIDGMYLQAENMLILSQTNIMQHV